MNITSKNVSHRYFNNKQFNKKIFLLIPFILLSVLLVIIPLILIFIKSFVPVPGLSFVDNWNFLNDFLFFKILTSFIIAFITTIVCVLLAYPFSYFLSQTKNKVYKSLIIFITTAPIWTSFLVKLVGLKTFFDLMYGFHNSTFGDVYTIIGLIYLYIPFMIMPIYSVLNTLPQNLIYASYDLGSSKWRTFKSIVLPYTKTALISGITLVFLPALTTVAVPQFLNNNSNGSMISDIIIQEGMIALNSAIALARTSTLSLVLSVFLLATFGFFKLLLFLNKKRVLKRKEKNV